MSRKRVSVHRQNVIAAQPDDDLPLINMVDWGGRESSTQTISTIAINDDEAGQSSTNQYRQDISIIDVEAAQQKSKECQPENSDMDVSGDDISDMSSSSKYSISTEDDEEKLREDLKRIYIEDNMNLTTLTKILHALKPTHPGLPLDARTLLGKADDHKIKQIGNGQYCHLGIEAGLRTIEFFSSNALHCLFNIDGLPLTKGNQQNLWPILCRVRNESSSVFPVGIYQGAKKPDCFNDFMAEFVNELKVLVANGITINERSFSIRIDGFIMDAPAASSMMYVTPYNGYNGCRKCCAHGEYHSKVVFPELQSPLRTDASFRGRNCPNHHSGTSLLETLPMDMVKCFPNDPMHLVHLGVVKKIIWQLMDRKTGGLQKLKQSTIDSINARLKQCRHFYPREFQRKPRDLHHYHTWKATEFRDFLLYTGPLVLKNNVPVSTYKHFMALSTAIRILSSKQYLALNKQADDLLKYFVKHFPTIYGKHHVTYNVHNLLHLASDSKHFGALETFSAYPFESFLGKLKLKCRSAYKPLEQICSRIYEMRSITAKVNDHKECNSIKLSKPNKNNTNYLRGTFSSFTITACQPGEDCVYLKTKNVVKITGFLNEHTFQGHEIHSVKEFYDKPASLHKLHNIFIGSISSNLQTFSVDDISFKFVYFPMGNDNFFFTPLMHTAA